MLLRPCSRALPYSLALILFWPSATLAGSADTLPRGVFSAELASYIALVGPPTFYWGGLGGQAGRQITVSRLPQLGALGNAFANVDPSSPQGNLGEVDLDYSVSAVALAPSLYYGVTDWLSVGFSWPIYVQAQTHIKKLEVGTGNLGYNALYPQNPAQAQPVVPASNPAAVTGTEGALRLAEEYFAYDPVKDWQDTGPGDLYLGGRARLLQTSWVRLALQLTVVLPLGQTDDPDNLVDWGLGDGQSDLAFSALVDFIRVPNLRLSGELAYTLQLPDSERLRVYPFEDFPFAPKTRKPGVYALLGQEMEVNRNLGDVLFAALSLEVTLLDWLTLSAGYAFDYRLQDSYSTGSGKSLTALAAGTSYYRHKLAGAAGLSTLVPFQKQRFPVPLYAQLQLNKTFSDDDDQASLMLVAALGLYFKLF